MFFQIFAQSRGGSRRACPFPIGAVRRPIGGAALLCLQFQFCGAAGGLIVDPTNCIRRQVPGLGRIVLALPRLNGPARAGSKDTVDAACVKAKHLQITLHGAPRLNGKLQVVLCLFERKVGIAQSLQARNSIARIGPVREAVQIGGVGRLGVCFAGLLPCGPFKHGGEIRGHASDNIIGGLRNRCAGRLAARYKHQPTGHKAAGGQAF